MVRKNRPPRSRPAVDLARLLLPENAPEFIYGVITIRRRDGRRDGAHETYAETFASALVATILYWLARAYTDLLGHRLASGERLLARARREARATGRS